MPVAQLADACEGQRDQQLPQGPREAVTGRVSIDDARLRLFVHVDPVMIIDDGSEPQHAAGEPGSGRHVVPDVAPPAFGLAPPRHDGADDDTAGFMTRLADSLPLLIAIAGAPVVVFVLTWALLGMSPS